MQAYAYSNNKLTTTFSSSVHKPNTGPAAEKHSELRRKHWLRKYVGTSQTRQDSQTSDTTEKWKPSTPSWYQQTAVIEARSTSNYTITTSRLARYGSTPSSDHRSDLCTQEGALLSLEDRRGPATYGEPRHEGTPQSRVQSPSAEPGQIEKRQGGVLSLLGALRAQ